MERSHNERECGGRTLPRGGALGRVGAFRDREGMIDPVKAAEATGQLAARLRGELVADNAELATLKSYMRDTAPSVRVLKPRIR